MFWYTGPLGRMTVKTRPPCMNSARPVLPGADMLGVLWRQQPARPLRPADRDGFLRDVATESRQPRRCRCDGELHRVITRVRAGTSTRLTWGAWREACRNIRDRSGRAREPPA